MPDYGHDLTFGCFLPPVAAAARRGRSRWPRRPTSAAWTWSPCRTTPTSRRSSTPGPCCPSSRPAPAGSSVMPNVANLPLRPPAVLARSAASLDLLSGGRVELGLGAGAFWDAIEAMGGPRRTPGEAVEALEEAITVIRALWSGERTPRHRGPALPADRRQARAGAGAPDRHLARRLPAADAGADRPAGRRLAAEHGLRAAGPARGHERRDRRVRLCRRAFAAATCAATTTSTPAPSRPSVWAEQLAELALGEGISGFIVTVELGGAAALARFAEEVAPAVRELVAAGRGDRGRSRRGRRGRRRPSRCATRSGTSRPGRGCRRRSTRRTAMAPAWSRSTTTCAASWPRCAT